jgi:hypothetical protein
LRPPPPPPSINNCFFRVNPIRIVETYNLFVEKKTIRQCNSTQEF